MCVCVCMHACIESEKHVKNEKRLGSVWVRCSQYPFIIMIVCKKELLLSGAWWLKGSHRTWRTFHPACRATHGRCTSTAPSRWSTTPSWRMSCSATSTTSSICVTPSDSLTGLSRTLWVCWRVFASCRKGCDLFHFFLNFVYLCFADRTPHVHKYALVTRTQKIYFLGFPLFCFLCLFSVFFNLCFETVGKPLPASAVNSKRGRTGKCPASAVNSKRGRTGKRPRIPKFLY